MTAAAAKGLPTDKTEKSSKCAYCRKPGHNNILVCFKLIAEQAAAKSDGPPGKKIAAATTQRTAEDTEEETGFMCYSYAGGRHPTLLPTDIILDTGANCSIVHNRSLLTNLKSCKPVIFDGLSGSISITQRGPLGTICEAYYHKDIVTNILSVSAIKNEGHILGYESSFYY